LSFLTAEWRWLAMVNFEVDPALLRPLVPRGTELDAFGGKTFASLVGFLFLGTRVLGVPVPFHRNFEEVNLRFYVRRGDRRGVVFVKEIVPRWAIAWVARNVYGERYVSLPMRHRLEGDLVEYGWNVSGEWCGLSVHASGPDAEAAPGSEEEFITEHYWGYAGTEDSCVEYEVKHPRWLLRPVTGSEISGSLEPLYGSAFASILRGKPSSAFLALGSAISVERGQRI